MDVDARAAEIADELYAIAPEDFTAERDARVKAARARGDRELANAVAAYRRPNRSAWAVNQLSRSRPQEVAELLDLGARLREAQRNLRRDEMRELAAERREVVGSLLVAARELASETGHDLSEAAEREVESTLEAALADEGAAAQVRTGRLTEPLAYAGFGVVDVGAGGKAEPSAEPAARATKQRTPSRTTRPAKKVATDELAGRRAAKAAATAATAAKAAEQEAGRDANAVDELAGRHQELADRVAALEEQLELARADYRAAGSELRAARKTAEGSARRARAARRRADETAG